MIMLLGIQNNFTRKVSGSPVSTHDAKEKGRDLTQSYDKTPTSTEKSRKQHDNTRRQQKLRLHNDFGPT